MSEFFTMREKRANRRFLPKEVWHRVLLDALLLVSVAAAPWWVSGAFALFGIIQFPLYIEAVLAASAFDILFGVPIPVPLPFIEDPPFRHFFLAGSLAVLAMVEVLKKRVRRYR